MSAVAPMSSENSRPKAAFQSTLWSQVRMAGGTDAPEARQALDMLCRVYWPPIYAFLRSYGHDHQTAKDLTQGFFLYLFNKKLLLKANPEKGRFRSFLLGTLKFYVSSEQSRQHAIKRGGGAFMISLDEELHEGCVAAEPSSNLSPERLFDRKWALAVIEEAMARLASEYRRGGQSKHFELLRPHLTGEVEEHLSALADRLGKSEGATRVLMFRLRSRFRKQIQAVVADTVSDLDQVETELQELQAALRDG